MIEIKRIADQFGLKIVGQADRSVTNACDLASQSDDSISWIKNQNYISQAEKGVFVIDANQQLPQSTAATFLISDRSAKITFALILQEFFTPEVDFFLKNDIASHRKNPKIKIGDNVFIGSNVIIGDGTVIFPNVVIEANTVIGKNCVIKSHVSLGTEGLGYELNPETNQLEKFPQLGKVILNDHVEIGPTSTVRRGALSNTVIGSYTKIGSLVNVGHNCKIGKNVILTCNIVTSGSSTIGDNVFVGVNTVIKNGANVGSDSVLGMGSVVTKSIPENVVAYGNPAKVIRANG